MLALLILERCVDTTYLDMGSWLSVLAMHPPTPANYEGNEPWVRYCGTVPYYQVGEKSSTVIIVSHGNAIDLENLKFHCDMIQTRTGATVIGYDYPGYGADLGATYSFEGMNNSLEQILGMVEGKYEQVFLLGWSLGTGATCQLAEGRDDLAGIILISPFMSIASTVLGRPIGILDALHNHERMAGIRCPVHVLHGTDDGVVPYTHGEVIWNLAPVKGVFTELEGADHNDTFTSHQGISLTFLEQVING